MLLQKNIGDQILNNKLKSHQAETEKKNMYNVTVDSENSVYMRNIEKW